MHVACNNAGITIHGRGVDELTPQEWEWNVGVNFYGVVHGLEIFLPLIRHHGGEGHIVNTASIAGFQIGGHRRSGSYGAMKFAVVALSELIAYDLKDTPIGVSVLAPAAVKTRIYTSGENRPARFGGPYAEPGNDAFQSELDEGLEPDVVGERVVRAIRHNEFYVFTHMHTKDWLLARHQRIIAAFDECEKSVWAARGLHEGFAHRGIVLLARLRGASRDRREGECFVSHAKTLGANHCALCHNDQHEHANRN